MSLTAAVAPQQAVTQAAEPQAVRKNLVTGALTKAFTPYRVIVGGVFIVLGFAFLGVVFGVVESTAVRLAVLVGFPLAVTSAVTDRRRRKAQPDA